MFRLSEKAEGVVAVPQDPRAVQGSIPFLKFDTRWVLRDYQRRRFLPQQGQNRFILALQAVRRIEEHNIRLDLGEHDGRAPGENLGTRPDSQFMQIFADDPHRRMALLDEDCF